MWIKDCYDEKKKKRRNKKIESKKGSVSGVKIIY